MSRSAREQVLEAAQRLFYSDGYRAVGVDRVIEESGVAKATFYRHFPTKDDLLLAVLDGRDRRFREQFEQRVRAIAPRPAARPLAIFDALADVMRAPDFRGCAFLNAMVEIADAAHPVHAAAQRHKAGLVAIFERLLGEAGYPATGELGAQLILLFDGAIVTGVREGSPEAALRARAIARSLFAARPRRSTRRRSKP